MKQKGSILPGVTERKEAQELYSTLADSSPVGVYIVQDGKFRFVNPQLQKYTGFSQDELLNRESLDIVHPLRIKIHCQGRQDFLGYGNGHLHSIPWKAGGSGKLHGHHRAQTDRRSA
jgi:PAS domain S-box-containing protein